MSAPIPLRHEARNKSSRLRARARIYTQANSERGFTLVCSTALEVHRQQLLLMGDDHVSYKSRQSRMQLLSRQEAQKLAILPRSPEELWLYTVGLLKHGSLHSATLGYTGVLSRCTSTLYIKA